MKAMVLAAGEGRRMLPLTRETPKPLLLAGGKSLIEHQLGKLAAAGIVDIVINHAWLGEQIEAAVGDGSRFGVQVRWSREGSPLETAGGILKALPLLGKEPFIVVNADIWTDYSFKRLQPLADRRYLAHLVLVRNPGHHAAGDFCLQEDGTVALQDGARQGFTYSGISVFHPDFFQGHDIGKLALRPLLDHAIREGRVTGELFEGEWIDIGTPQRLQMLDRKLQGRFS